MTVFSLPKALLNGLFCAAVGVLVALPPFGATLEEELGLDRLFKIRGERRPPDEVVVISIDRDSGRESRLPRKPGRWPRSTHAELVEQLAAADAAAVAFDVAFVEPQDADGERRFAAVIEAAGNVILLQFLG